MKPREPRWEQRFFPHYHWGQVPAEAVQEALRTLFEIWGRPRRIRVDNGTPWGSWSDLPPDLALWWVGLDIEPIWNHPHTPKENAFVERFNGLVDTWGEPGQCADLDTFAQRMRWVAQVQREVYPGVRGKSRLESYPALKACLRPYTPSEEAALFDIDRVKTYLALGHWVRLVGKT